MIHIYIYIYLLWYIIYIYIYIWQIFTMPSGFLWGFLATINCSRPLRMWALSCPTCWKFSHAWTPRKTSWPNLELPKASRILIAFQGLYALIKSFWNLLHGRIHHDICTFSPRIPSKEWAENQFVPEQPHAVPRWAGWFEILLWRTYAWWSLRWPDTYFHSTPIYAHIYNVKYVFMCKNPVFTQLLFEINSSTEPRKVKLLKATIQKIEVEFGPCRSWGRAGRNDGTIIYKGFLWWYHNWWGF